LISRRSQLKTLWLTPEGFVVNGLWLLLLSFQVKINIAMLITILIFIAILAVLVLAHEFGHFIVAKKSGCKVEEFGFGFPPKLFSYKPKNSETEYSFNLLPLGGFVKIKGENGEDTEDPKSFSNKPAWKRLSILVAGVAMNIVLAIVLMQIVMTVGVERMMDDHYDDSVIIKNHGVQIVEIIKDSPAHVAGIQAGSWIQSLEGVEKITIDSVTSAAKTQPDLLREIVVQKGEEFFTTKISAQHLSEINDYGFGVGLSEIGTVSYAFPNSLWKGVTETWWITSETFKGLAEIVGRMVSGEKIEAEVSGPVGIAILTNEVRSHGWIQLLQFMALLSVNLAIINILPFPALDGGRIIFVLLEKIRGGKKVKPEFEGIVHLIGFVLLIGLIVFITYKDIMKLFA